MARHIDIASRNRSTALGAYLEGWRRTLAAPYLVLGVLLTTMAVSFPLAGALEGALESRFGSSLAGDRAAQGWDQDWAEEFATGRTDVGGTFTFEIMGFGSILRSISMLVGGERLPAALITSVSAYLMFWIFLSGGVIDRLARGRALGADVFLATCGRNFLRLLRFGLIAAGGYWIIFSWLHPAIFAKVVPWLAGASPAESRLLLWRALGTLVFLIVLGGFALVADMGRVRLVVEDRLSALAGWTAGWRFVRRRPGRMVALFLLNILGQLVLARLWLQLIPGGDRPDWLVLGGATFYLLVRVWTRLTFIASEVVFFQGELAHATYTAAPPALWPDSPSVEGLRNLRGAGGPGVEPRLR